MVFRKSYVASCLASIALSACNIESADPGSVSNPVGVCSHSFKEPVLTISYANDALTGDALREIYLRNVSVNGSLLINSNAALIGSSNIRGDGPTFVCTLPCAIGTEEGVYRLFVDAVGYQSQVVAILANYRVFSGGCPSYSDQGLHIGLNMEQKF